ncbi:MAG: nucleoside deaminase [Alcaligenaceae bacterium]|jgi:guanine deaminase|nr:nucleoside deaminase [Alcaligenaceae bacterium]
MSQYKDFLRQAIKLAYESVEKGGRPFGALVVKGEQVIASAVNMIVQTNDPTAHAELLAIREASQYLGTANLEGCVVFASGHPCPMCLAAMRMAGIKEVIYAYSNEDASPFGLSTEEVYADLAKPFEAQSMQIQFMPVRLENEQDLYAYYAQRQLRT